MSAASTTLNNATATRGASQLFYEGCGREGPIRCIFLSTFHPQAGPKITCQVPEGYITKDVFDAVNVYIIPKTPLQRCILTVNTLGHKIVGFPVRIDNQRYPRNAYYFNLCFVCDSWARTVQYEPVVKKLAEYFIMMEDESGFLSQDERPDDPVPTTTPSNIINNLQQQPSQTGIAPRIRHLLATILHDLNTRKVSTTVVGETTIYLQILTHLPDPPPVADHLVPLLRPDYRRQPVDRWDLTTQQVLPFIDGSMHIARIAAESDVEAALVKACIQNLVYYGVVQLLPLLKYSNVYMCTRSLQRLTKEPALGAACRRFVALDCTAEKTKKVTDRVAKPAAEIENSMNFEDEGSELTKLEAMENQIVQNGDSEDKSTTATAATANLHLRRPSLQKILLMYSYMTHGVNLRTLCQRTSPRENGIDERKLVTFGLQHQLIRCINKYPICTTDNNHQHRAHNYNNGSNASTANGRQKFYTGQHSIDEICCRAGLQPAKIDEDIDSDPQMTVFWK